MLNMSAAVKRVIDIIVSGVALLVLAPLFVVLGTAIAFDSPGPVFFSQERVGRGMRRFRVRKFRTMAAHRPHEGMSITPFGDPRVTRVGCFLRRTKLDELPQLWNVLAGDMSLVGPRPEVPKYVERFRAEYEIILAVRPGLTDLASLKYRREDEILAKSANPELEYLERILPDKIRLAKEYVARSSLALDASVLLKTVLDTIGMEGGPAVRWILSYRRPIVVCVHLALFAISYYAAWLLRFDGRIPAREITVFWRFLPWLLALRAVTFVPFRLYQGLWRYTSVSDGVSIAGAVVLSSVSFVLLVRGVFGVTSHPRAVFFIDAVLLVVMATGVRLVRRAYHDLAAGGSGARVLVFGAADSGEMLVRELKKSVRYRVVGLLDDDREKKGRRIHGVAVLGGRPELPGILARHRPAEILLAMERLEPEFVRDLLRLIEPFNVRLTTIPRVERSLGGVFQLSEVRQVRVEDLLTRAAVGLDGEPVKQLIAARRVMVTGAGGSIGSELCRQIADLKPAALIMFERYENSLHAIRLELEDRKRTFGLHPVIGDVTDPTRIAAVLAEHEPEIVFHAAAHKHVPLMEENPCEAVKNNVRGTRLLAEAAERYGVDRFILISTDKAVNPTSIMGASKRVAELVVQAQAHGSGTSFSVVRFGNVLGSNGSVVPRFMEQIRKGGPVTITHPEMRRFFMLIPEAVQLVLHAAAQAESGATYVLEMGKQVKLVDMARDLIRLSGLAPEEDVKIEFVGLRPGEKLCEELVGPDEEVSRSSTDKILCVRSSVPPPQDLAGRVESLEQLAFEGRRNDVRAALGLLTGAFVRDASEEVTAKPLNDVLTVTPVVRTAQACPKCAGVMHRSHARTITERLKKGFTHERLYRCDSCGWRAWLTPLQYAPDATVAPEAAPDLTSLDAAFGQLAPEQKRSFSPRNLI